MRKELDSQGYKNGYVTVDTYDWYLDSLLQNALEQGKPVNFDKLKKVYLRLLTKGAEYYEDLAKSAIKRSPKHTLLLHENDLLGLFLSDLIAAFRLAGWEIVSADDAYADPLSLMEPDTLSLVKEESPPLPTVKVREVLWVNGK